MEGRLLPQPDLAHLEQTLAEKGIPAQANAGLVFRRYLAGWEQGREVWEFDARALDEFARAFNALAPGQGPLLAEHVQRLDRSLGPGLIGTTTARLAIGLGGAHPAENSFTFDPTLGVPVLPGSSIKGLTRAWAELLGVPPRSRDLLFGPDHQETGGTHQGDLVFLPALPRTWPRMERDIINCHLPLYYQGTGRNPHASPKENPVPVFFLTVASGCEFVFRLRSRSGSAENLGWGISLLQDALDKLGIGGKTAVGYGTFAFHPRENPNLSTRSLEPKQIVLWVNADKAPLRDEVLSRLPASSARVERALSPVGEPPPLRRFGANPEPVDWDQLQTRVEGLAESALEVLRRTMGPTHTVVHGFAPLAAFTLLGHLLGPWSGPATVVNRRAEGAWDDVRSEGLVEAGDRYLTTRGVPDETSSATGLIALFISAQGGGGHQYEIGRVAAERAIPVVHYVEAVSDEPLDAANGPHAAAELKTLMTTLAGRFPRQQGLIVAVRGPASLAFLVGRAINPRMFRRIILLDWSGGAYDIAIELPRRREQQGAES